jgi:hypothetical protein
VNAGALDPLDPAPSTLEPIRAGLLHDGVAVVPGLVPEDLCARARRAIDDWRAATGASDGARTVQVPLNQHPAFWEIRQHPPVYALFRALLGTPFLWVTVDAGLHEAASAPASELDPPFGWEMDPRLPGRHLRGLVLLSDAGGDTGVFRCIPHIFRNPEPWWSIYGIEPIPAARIRDDQVHSVRAGAGSLVIWDARLPTGRAANRTVADRYGLLLTMDLEGDEARRAERLRNFEEGRPPAWARTLPGQQRPGALPRAELTDLGDRLLGRTPW